MDSWVQEHPAPEPFFIVLFALLRIMNRLIHNHKFYGSLR